MFKMHASIGGLAVATALFLADTALAEPRTVPWEAPASVTTESIAMTIPSGDAQISGTLYHPRSGGPFPALIALHTASSPRRDAGIFQHLIKVLPSIGIAVFVFDRRGEGATSGAPARGDYARLADDGIAVRKAVAAHPRIDGGKTGYWGLSQGGWLAVLAASRDPGAAFAVSVSAPLTSPDVQMNFAVANILRIKGVADPEIEIAIAARRSVDDYMRGKVDRPTAQRALDRAASYPWFDDIYMSRTFADPAQSGWAKEMKHNPVETLRLNSAPTLLIFGARDPWIPVAASVELLAGEKMLRPNWTVAVIADADHSMMTSATPAEQIDTSKFQTHAPESQAYIATLARWITRLGI